MITSAMRPLRASGAPEARDPVGDRLEPGERRATVGEGTQAVEDAESHQPSRV